MVGPENLLRWDIHVCCVSSAHKGHKVADIILTMLSFSPCLWRMLTWFVVILQWLSVLGGVRCDLSFSMWLGHQPLYIDELHDRFLLESCFYLFCHLLFLDVATRACDAASFRRRLHFCLDSTFTFENIVLDQTFQAVQVFICAYFFVC